MQYMGGNLVFRRRRFSEGYDLLRQFDSKGRARRMGRGHKYRDGTWVDT